MLGLFTGSIRIKFIIIIIISISISISIHLGRSTIHHVKAIFYFHKPSLVCVI